MKKSTLFVLLLAAVLLFMTACNPATKEPAATDDPTKIPGVTEDQNVPATPDSAEAADISNILNALSSLTKVDPSIVKFGSSSATIKAVNGKITVFGGPEQDIDADYTFTTSVAEGSNSSVTTIDGTLKLGEQKYEFENLSATVTFNDNYQPQSLTHSGTCKHNGKPLEENKDIINAINNASYVMGSEYAVSMKSETTTKISYDKEGVVVGNVAIKSSITSEKTTRVVIANLKFGEELIPMTAKYIVSSTKDNTSIEIKYASYNNVYFTGESLLKDENIKTALLSLNY